MAAVLLTEWCVSMLLRIRSVQYFRKPMITQDARYYALFAILLMPRIIIGVMARSWLHFTYRRNVKNSRALREGCIYFALFPFGPATAMGIKGGVYENMELMLSLQNYHRPATLALVW